MTAAERPLPRFRKLRLCLRIVRDAWCVVGVALLLFVGLNALLSWMGRFAGHSAGMERLSHAASLDEDESLAQLALEMQQTHDTFDTTAVRWEPLVYWRSRPYDGHHVRIDDEGIRATWKPETGGGGGAAVRIFCFGGSTMWGSGVPDDQTIPSHIARLLWDGGVHAEVVNYGQLGYMSTQELVALMREVQQGNVPTVALFYDGINDINSAGFNVEAGLPVREFLLGTAFDAFQDPTLVKLGSIYVQRSPVAKLFGSTWHRGEAVERRISNHIKTYTPQQFAQDIVSAYVMNVIMADTIANEFGFTCLFYWQPTIHSKEVLSPHEEQVAAKQGSSGMYDLLNQTIRDAHDELAQGHPDLAKRLNVIDDIFDHPDWDGETAFYDAWHVSDKANAWIAARMQRDLSPTLAGAQ